MCITGCDCGRGELINPDELELMRADDDGMLLVEEDDEHQEEAEVEGG